MTEAPVKPTMQKKTSVQAYYGYSVRMIWFQKDFQAKSSPPVNPTVIGASRRCNDVNRGWQLEFNGQ
jgi:hypothetical protein